MIYYMDLEMPDVPWGSGTEISPWSYAGFFNAQGELTNGDTIKIKGQKTTSILPEMHLYGKWIIWDKWEDEPWRINFDAIPNSGPYKYVVNIVMKNGILSESSSAAGVVLIGAVDETPDGIGNVDFTNTCFLSKISGNDHGIVIIAGGPNQTHYPYLKFRGCLLYSEGNIPKLIIEHEYCLAGSGIAAMSSVHGEGKIDFYDCMFPLRINTVIASLASVNFFSCAITTITDLVSLSTNIGSQLNWNWNESELPDWDDPKEGFGYNSLSVNIDTPPQPGIGAPTYGGYETDPWGNPRTGIGFGYMLATHTVNFVAGAHGSLTGDTSQTVYYNESCTPVTAVPVTGYSFSAWSGDNTSTNNPLTITNVTDDMDTTANFAVATYTVNFVAGAHGSITGEKIQIIGYGGSCSTVHASPDDGYDFSSWSGDRISSADDFTVTNVTSDLTISANFSQKFSHKKIHENRGNNECIIDSTNGLFYPGRTRFHVRRNVSFR